MRFSNATSLCQGTLSFDKCGERTGNADVEANVTSRDLGQLSDTKHPEEEITFERDTTDYGKSSSKDDSRKYDKQASEKVFDAEKILVHGGTLPLFTVMGVFAVGLVVVSSANQFGLFQKLPIGWSFGFALTTVFVIGFALKFIHNKNKEFIRNRKKQQKQEEEKTKSENLALFESEEELRNKYEPYPDNIDQAFLDSYRKVKEHEEEKRNKNPEDEDQAFLDSYKKAKDFEENQSNKSYPDDIYSFMALYGGKHNDLFLFGFAVFVFQFSLLLLMALNVIVPRLRTLGEVDNTESGSWLGTEIFPANAGHLVRATQVISIMAFVFFPMESLMDITAAVQLFPFVGKKSEAKEDDDNLSKKIFWLRLSCALRFIQGMLSTLAVWLLVMTSPDVVDIILNFTAINFISGLDNHAFELAQNGKYGKRIKSAADKISEKELPKCVLEHSRHDTTQGHMRYKKGIIITCFVLYISTVFIMVTQDNSKQWVTPVVRVQFADDTRTAYSGCYHISKNNEIYHQRYIWNGDDSNIDSNAKIGYCLEKRRWLMFHSDDDPCTALGTENEIAHSAKTDTYEIQSSIQEDWFSAFNTPINNMYFIESEDTEELQRSCDSFPGDGQCDEFLNNFDYEYDGGDCCATSCKGEDCGRESNSTLDIIDYQSCVDPKMTPLTIELNETVLSNVSHIQLNCESDGPLKTVFNIPFRSTVPVMIEQGYTCMLTSGTPDSGFDPEESYHVYHNSGPIPKVNASSFEVPLALFSRGRKLEMQNIESYIDLEYLDLQNNGLTGTIPSEIGMLTNLKYLNLDGNSFTGTLPKEFWDLPGPPEVYLPPHFEGPIPNTRRMQEREKSKNGIDTGVSHHKLRSPGNSDFEAQIVSA